MVKWFTSLQKLARLALLCGFTAIKLIVSLESLDWNASMADGMEHYPFAKVR